MINTRMSRLLTAVLLMVTVADVGLLFRAAWRRATPRADASLLRGGTALTQRMRPPLGYGATGERTARRSTTSGWVVRYVSADCPFSEMDAHGKQLLSELRDRGYQVFVTVTRASASIAAGKLVPADASQSVFVSMDWIRGIRLNVTPSLLVFDAQGRALWQHEGMLTAEDLSAARLTIGPTGNGT